MENKEERKKFLKVLQGGLPNIKEIRKALPYQLNKIKQRMLNVKDVELQGLEETEEQIKQIEREYGENLEYLYEFQDYKIKELYRKINDKKFIFYIEQAEQIKQNKKTKKKNTLIKEYKEKNIGKEPGE